jgi:hypothetical protein
MHRAVYDSQRWRELPRTECLVSVLLDEAAGPCSGLIHRHHVDPADPFSRTVPVCAAHHAKVHSVLRRLGRVRRCPHRHPTRAGREDCERRLNRAA